MLEVEKMFLTIDRLEQRVHELEKYRFVDMKTLAPMEAMPGGLEKDEVYHEMPEEIKGLHLQIGDDFAGRDRYLWVRKKVKIPKHQDGYEAYGLFNFGKTGDALLSGFESLLYVDGQLYQGVDTFHHDVNFESLADRNVELTFLLWTGLEGGGPKREFCHRFRQADIGYLHLATDELYYLTKAMAETLRYMEDANPDKYVLIRALEHVFATINWDEDGFYVSAENALAVLKNELRAFPKKSNVTVNVVGHTHIDVAWLWRLKHTREKIQRSFSTVLRLMSEFDDYVFLQSQPQLYQYLQKDNPVLYEQIKKRIAEGRWEADGGMWLEADCNISSGEALIRQFLYGIRFFKKEFGRRCEFLWLPDVFGYSWALPQILNGVEIHSFVTTKISWNQFNSMPHDLFRWRGMDGSEVITYFISTPSEGETFDKRMATYNGMMNPHSVIGSWEKFHDKNLSNETLISYGFGDGGGGVNREMLKMRRAMESIPGLPAVKQSRANDFLKRLHEKMNHSGQYIPVWDGELYLEFHRGTYTSQAWNKKMNRRMEFVLAETEWLATQAWLAGGTYCREKLTEGWQTLLRNQFHDIIPGSSIHEVYEDCRLEYGQLEDSLQKLQAGSISTLAAPEKNSYTFWNFGSFARTDEVKIPETRDGYFLDGEGKRLQAQKTQDGYWVKISLDSLATAVIHFEEAPWVDRAKNSPFVWKPEARKLQTPHYIAEWNADGEFIRLFDRENEREVFPAGVCANVLEIYEDKPLNFDNWDVDLFHLLKHENLTPEGSPELISEGTLRLVLRFRYRYHHSHFEQDVIFHADSRRIDFETRAEWHEKHRLLKAAFPAEIRTTKATYDIQCGYVERPTHFNTSWDYARFEVVAHKWADISEDGYGVSLLNDCKYGHSVNDNVLRITLLKSGKYPDEEADMGSHEFTYALLPHKGTVTDGNTIEEATKLNLPLRMLAHKVWKTQSLFISNTRNIIIDAVKLAEEDETIILRIHECRGSHTSVVLRPSFEMKAYAPCNLLEEIINEKQNAYQIMSKFRPFEIQTFKIWVK